MGPSKIYIIRHAESVHNVTKDFSIRDPGLTPLGFTQASALTTTFPAHSSIGVIISSPLRRTIETTLAAFGDAINKGKVKLALEGELQERSDFPCDTGRSPAEVKNDFPVVDVSGLKDDWYVKEGANQADDASVAERAKSVRKKLAEVVKGLEGNDEKDVVVVTHGVFMKFLTEDETIDLQKAGWRAYVLDGETLVEA